MLQKNIIDNPEQEQYLNEQIESLKKQNESIEKNQIPMLMYRLEKNIVPGLKIWQNTAIADIEEALRQLRHWKRKGDRSLGFGSHLTAGFKKRPGTSDWLQPFPQLVVEPPEMGVGHSDDTHPWNSEGLLHRFVSYQQLFVCRVFRDRDYAWKRAGRLPEKHRS
jgi:hypothetical protein